MKSLKPRYAGFGRRMLLWTALLLSLASGRELRGAQAALTEEDVVGASRVAGIEFTEGELHQMLARLKEQLGALEEMRRVPIDPAQMPALRFDPRPPGFVMPASAPSIQWVPARRVRLPQDRADWAFLSVEQWAGLLRSRAISSEELTRYFLERLKQYGPALHCVVTLTEQRALESARAADRELRAGRWRGPLHGVPYGVKDLLDVAGVPSTWGISLRTNQIASADSSVVRKLDAAGAVLVAKLSLGELAMGDVWYGGLTRNPWKPETGSSGSSAGSASAVAAGLVPFAIGSETLGSIVSPSTVCGVTGLRPTFGRVSRSGAMMLCFSLDKLGPLARSAWDCALVLEVIRGSDGRDVSVIDAPFSAAKKPNPRRLRIGYLAEDFGKSYANQTNDQKTLETLRALGLTLKPVTLPKHPKGVLYSLLAAEAAMSFDELTRQNQDDRLVQQDAGSWPNTFRSARFITAVDYLQAGRIRARLMEDFQRLFSEVDVVVAPSWRGNQLLYSNMTGHPCVVVPNGEMGQGPPPSVCFLSGLFREADALTVAQVFQESTEWNRRRPDLTRVK
jgi:Asp-tRNA(Asn)/Glu-tRNA(Gln) amidotransferase A subunit family amidase